MIALALAALVAAQEVAAQDADAGAPAWCSRAMELATAPPPAAGTESQAFDAMALAMPREATPIVARARELAGEEGLDRSMAVLRFAVFDACASAAPVPNQDAAAQAAALMNDERFSGVRKGDGTFDRLMHKAYLWFIALVESEGMQKYAGGSRVVFLSLIAIGALVLTVTTLRKRRSEAAAARGSGDDVERKEASRKEAYASLRARAEALLGQGDARESLRVADAALLARVGELDESAAQSAKSAKGGAAKGAATGAPAGTRERAVTAARTHREIVARLPSHVSDVVRTPFATFDVLFFGRPSVGVDDARAFLASVDAAEAQLASAGSASSASSPSSANDAGAHA